MSDRLREAETEAPPAGPLDRRGFLRGCGAASLLLGIGCEDRARESLASERDAGTKERDAATDVGPADVSTAPTDSGSDSSALPDVAARPEASAGDSLPSADALPQHDGPVGTLRNPSSDPDAIVWMLHSTYQSFIDPVNHEHYAFRDVRQYCTRASYCPPGQYLLNGFYDHSEAGIDHAAKKLSDFAIARFGSEGARICNINIEQYDSTNVPSPLTDGTLFGSQPYDKKGANTDYFTHRAGIRREAHRYRYEVASRALQNLASAGYGFIEFFDYNLPRKYNADVTASPMHPGIVFEANEFAPYYGRISGFGPQAGQNWAFPYLQDEILAGSTSARNTLINQQTGMISDRMIAYANVGIQFRHVAWPWPFMFISGNKEYQYKPVPSGYMTQMLDSFYAAGTRRFFSFIWRYARDMMTTAQRNQAVANLEEAAAWIQTKANAGKVVVIGTSLA